MRVALVVTGGVDESADTRVVPALLWLIERLSRRVELHVYALRYLSHPRSYPLLGAVVHDLGRPRGLVRQQRSLAHALRRDGPFDLVHGYWALPAGLNAVIAARRLHIPSIATLDSGEFVGVPEARYGQQLRFRHRGAVSITCRLASALTACTKYQADLAETAGFRAEIVPIGVDTSLFTPETRDEGPPWRLLHVASLNPVKNQVLLLDAMARLQRRGVDAHLDIVGEDTLDGRLQMRAAELGIERHVTFHGLKTSRALVPFYRRAHVALLASHHEAAGVTLLEAAACGVPVAGTRVGYIADWAPDASEVLPAHADGFADGLARLLADRSRRDRIAATARAWALAHDADWSSRAFYTLYDRLTQPRRPH